MDEDRGTMSAGCNSGLDNAAEDATVRPAGSRGRKNLFAGIFSARLDKSASRIRLAAWLFLVIYGIIAGKLIDFGVHPDPLAGVRRAASEPAAAARPDILDRNGELLATDVKVMSVFAEPRRIIDKDEAVELLTAVLPDLDARELRERLGSRKGFVWVKRAVTPKQRQEVYHLGLPGVGFLSENKRVYPNGPVAAHVLGFASLDGIGISGLEKYIDGQGLADLHGAGFSLTPDNLTPITTSLDLKATYAVRDELAKGIAKFKAKAGAAAILDVNYRGSRRNGVLARLRSEHSGRRTRSQSYQPAFRWRL